MVNDLTKSKEIKTFWFYILILLTSNALAMQYAPCMLDKIQNTDPENINVPQFTFKDKMPEALNSDSDINKLDEYGQTLLIRACRDNDAEMVKFLLDNNASIDIIDKFGKSALNYTIENFNSNLDITVLLKQAINFTPASTLTDLGDKLTEVPSAALDINKLDEYGQTLLIRACRNNDAETVKFLLDNNASIDIIDKFGKSALNYTIENFNSNLDITALLAQGQTTNFTPTSNLTSIDLFNTKALEVSKTLNNPIKNNNLTNYSANNNSGHDNNVENTQNIQKDSKDRTCQICHKIFSTLSNLRAHKIAVHTLMKNHKCDKCTKSFTNRTRLNAHIKRVHKDQTCQICHKIFSTPSNLQTHKAAVHTLIKNHKCDKCTKDFINKTRLNEHIKRVHLAQKRFHCRYEGCNYSAYKNNDVTKHYDGVHLKIKKWTCNFPNCTFKTKWSGDLTRHRKMLNH